MSLFNFNPSGFLGSGAFTLDPSKFNFSNITAPTVVDKPDPLDIVSDNTPEVKVEVDEPTGGMLFTQEPEVKSGVKPTPIVEPQAPTVMPTDFAPAQPTPINLGMNFGVDTTLSTNNIPTSFDTVGDISQVVVDQDKVEQDIENTVNLFNTKSSVLSGLGLAPMGDAFAPSMFTQNDRAPVQTGTKTVNGVKVPETVTAIGATSEYIDSINNLLSSDKANEFVKQMSEQTGEEYTKQDFVESLGLTWGDDAFTVSGKYGGFSLYEYDEESNQYVKTLDKESSAVDAYLPVVADAIQDFFYKGVLTAGLGTLVGSTETVQNIKQASDVVKAVEDDNVLGAVAGALDLAGLPSPTDYVEGFIEDSLAETADLGSVGNAIGNWAFNNADHLAEATVKFADTAIKGGNLGDATKDAVVEYIKDGGGISDLMPEGNFDFPDIDFEVPEVIEDVAQLIADGASEFNREIIKPVVKTVEETVDPLVDVVRETGREVEDVYDVVEDFVKEDVAPVVRETGRTVEEEILKPTEDIIKETAEPVVDVVRETGRTAEEVYGDVEDLVKEELSGFDDTVLQPVRESIETVVKTVDEKLGEFDDAVLQPTKDTIIETAQGIEDFYKTTIEPSIEQGIEDTKQLLSDFDSNVLQPIKESGEEVLAAVDEKLGEFDDAVLQPIKENIEGVIDTVDEALKDFDDNVLQEIKEAGEAGIEYVDNALSELNKNVIQPALDSIEEALDGIDIDTDGLKNMIRSLFDMVNFSNTATASMIKSATAKGFEPVDLTTVELTTPELVKGFEYDDLSNKLLA